MLSRLLSSISFAVALFVGLQIAAVWSVPPLSTCGSEIADSSVPLKLVSAVLQQEDQKFFHHHGIDWTAVRYALKHNLKVGEVRYGASTIDMQVASLCYLKSKQLNRWVEKLREMLIVALHFGAAEKPEILRAYLSAAPLGEGTVGFFEASNHYFDKPLQELSREEIWSLVLTLKNENLYNPAATNTNKELPRRSWLRLQKAKYKNKEVSKALESDLKGLYFVKS